MNAAPASLQTEPEDRAGGAPGAKRRRPRRRTVVVIVAVVAGAGVAFAVVNPFGGDSKAKDTANGAPTGLATVTQGRLSARTSVSGTLTYLGAYRAINQAGGTFTRLPRANRVYRQGQVIYRVDGKPVILLKGSTPLYRDLKQGMRGADVKQLNAALVALGYAGSELNPRSGYFGWATADALEELQDDVGMEEDGELDKGQAVILPDDRIRVTKVTPVTGAAASAGTEVFQASSTDRQVTVAVDATSRSQVKVGDKVTITLPDLKTTPGTVESVGTVVKKNSSGGATINVRIRPTDPKATGNLDQAPVSVSIVTESVADALSVPVNALLALLGGGYGVEVVDPGGTRRLVPVTLGLFDNTAGTVQVTGKGLAAGQRVVVPAS
ncbi:peptidoglycan-binding protein [Actinomadura viridis]|uniref:Peptidoglycan hydrolase-like protein with peptidoglycan-binding domain n=1 Tax=Actinomadura viridis TaxID=58110 RepID=A0A931D935_9ACTN|nr:peptidoglycan-binding protein [Actinomadura viridis]MBG6085900.1 peptidoglycan hydrolase-like protein with peptidoglycan-binding domain [Actinomadura viridis]